MCVCVFFLILYSSSFIYSLIYLFIHSFMRYMDAAARGNFIEHFAGPTNPAGTKQKVQRVNTATRYSLLMYY